MTDSLRPRPIPVERHFGKFVLYTIHRTELGVPVPPQLDSYHRVFNRRSEALTYLNMVCLDYGIAAKLRTIPAEEVL
jgi:hypothetical protein